MKTFAQYLVKGSRSRVYLVQEDIASVMLTSISLQLAAVTDCGMTNVYNFASVPTVYHIILFLFFIIINIG